MTNSLRHRLAYLYALLIGILGLLVLVRLFADQTTDVDLATLLAFTLTALILSYFRVPIGKVKSELGLEGAILLAAALAGGPALGGWVAFVTGLVTGIIPLPGSAAHPRDWPSSISTALLNGGRNVLAMVVAWWAYRGLDGRAEIATIDTMQALAVVILCVAFAIVRFLWQWPMAILQGNSPRWRQFVPDSLIQVPIELVPLPAALLTAVTFVELGWSFFLLLVFVFVGLSALLRQTLVRIQDLEEQVETAELSGQIKEAIATAPPELSTLSELAYDLCRQLVPAPRFELGLYDNQHTHVNIQISSNKGVKLPPMKIPITPRWAWLGELGEPQLFQDQAQLEQLPFSMPPIDDKPAQTAMFVPITNGPTTEKGQTVPPPVIGGIALFAPHPAAFTKQDLVHTALIAERVGIAISQARQAAQDRDST
jgi:hypothetical protein